MGNTANYVLRYPELADVPNVQGDIKNLASDVDAKMANGVPTGVVVNGQWIKGQGGVPIWSAIVVADVSGAEATANKGVANGYASLDGTAKVPSAQLPAAVPGPGTLIGYTQLTSTGTSVSLTGAATAMTGLAVTFIAPASGNVLVKVSIGCNCTYQSINGQALIVCTIYSAGVAIGQNQAILVSNSTTVTGRGNFAQVYTGLTPGNSYTFTPNFDSWNGNVGNLVYGSGGAGLGSNPPYGPAVHEVYAL